MVSGPTGWSKPIMAPSLGSMTWTGLEARRLTHEARVASATWWMPPEARCCRSAKPGPWCGES